MTSATLPSICPIDLDTRELARRLAPVGLSDVRPLAGGASSLTFAGDVGGRQAVVKVAPPGLPPVLNRDVLRQARLLRALAPTPVPVPEVLWEDAGEPPDVPPLFVMSFVEGSSVEPLFDLDDDGTAAAVVAERLRDAARTMAALHAVDVTAVGLADEPVVGPADEVARWSRLLETVDQALVPGWQDVGERLRSTAPAPARPAIVHGDFRLGNLLAVGERITAVIDWEIWTVGDPRVDVGWFLANADPDTYQRATRYAGATPSPAELLAAYGDTPGTVWFQALACFKSAATWSLIVKHNRRRPSPDANLEAMAGVLPQLLSRAGALLG